MVNIIISLPKSFSEDVKFLVRPTVAVALAVSYIMSSAEALVVADSNMVAVNIIAKDIAVTANALLTVCFVRVLPNISVLVLPRTEAIAEASKTVKVTVLMPPAVPNYSRWVCKIFLR